MALTGVTDYWVIIIVILIVILFTMYNKKYENMKQVYIYRQ